MQVDAPFLGGSDVLRVVPWPLTGTVLDFLSKFRDVELSFLVHPYLADSFRMIELKGLYCFVHVFPERFIRRWKALKLR